MPDTSQIEVFRAESDETAEITVGLVIVDPSIVEFDGELQPGCTLDAQQARNLGHALILIADQIQSA